MNQQNIDSANQRHDAYERDYMDWKGWASESFGTFSATDRRYYDAELRKTGLALAQESLRVLEIGFGNGQFLAYAKTKGWHTTGTELNRKLVDLARVHQFDAFCSTALTEFNEDEFDLIAAFDVLEHISQNDMLDYMRCVWRVLKPGGIFLARFPNGDSPFGLPNQNGDLTHASMLGSGKIHHMARELRASIIHISGEAQPIMTGNFKRTAYRTVAIPMRKLVNFVIRALIFPESQISFCSQNLVAALQRTNSRGCARNYPIPSP